MFTVPKRSLPWFALIPFLGLLGGCPPPDGGNGDVTPPPPVIDKGVVAYLTADDTSLTVGQTTAGRLWVQQTSPNQTNDNGVLSVGVDIDAAPADIIQAKVPVTFVAPWDSSITPILTGTAAASGGITGIGTSGLTIPPDNTLAIGAPIQVATFQITAKAVGTVTLTPKSFNGGGYIGVTPVVGPNGDEANYVPVQITVQ